MSTVTLILLCELLAIGHTKVENGITPASSHDFLSDFLKSSSPLFQKKRSEDGITIDAGVKASQIPGRSIAAFLNLPFKAEDGMCNGNLNVTMKQDLLLPYVSGDVFLEAVKIVFHPDPS